MAVVLRVLGQLYPTANVETVLYTCNTTSVVISTLAMANCNGAADIISGRICIANESNDNKQLLFSNLNVAGNSILQLTAGLTLANTDVLKVTSQNGTTSFQMFGQENT